MIPRQRPERLLPVIYTFARPRTTAAWLLTCSVETNSPAMIT